tara:strand:- start:85 stop:717 length:633 start_codon:yes stop_codon:yes gene_type:complete
MSYLKEGSMIILSSPSGAGKTTLVKKIAKNKNFDISISHTTRKPRVNEKNGIDYHFIKKKDFKDLINRNKFLEFAKVFKNYYGSNKDMVINKLNKKKNVIFDIDWQGTRQIKNKKLKFKLLTIFILPPSKNELLKRLINREKKLKFAKIRMKQFKKDLMHWDEYDFVVINDDLEKCYKEIIKYIKSNLKKKSINSYKIKKIKNHVSDLLK